MKEKLTRNLALKALSVVLAFVIWLAVVNVSNPETTGTKKVNVQVVNENVILDSGKTYELEDNLTVSVSFTVRTRDLYKVNASDFKAYIDLADLYEVTGSVPVQVAVVNNENLFIGQPVAVPGVVHVVVDDFIRMEVGVAVSTVGDVTDGYYIGGASVQPTSVTVRGPRNLISDIEYAQIDVNVEGATGDIEGREELKYYNSAGRQIDINDSRITISLNKIKYTVFVEPGELTEPIPETTVAAPTREAIQNTAPHVNITDNPQVGPGGLVPEESIPETLPASGEGTASDSEVSSPSDTESVPESSSEEIIPQESESEIETSHEAESTTESEITESDNTEE